MNLWLLPATAETDDETAGDASCVLVAHVPNPEVGPLIDRLEEMGEVEISLEPRGVLALRPPESEATEQVADVELRSPLEVFLAGLQSVGSWTGFLGYAAAAGIIVWVGLFTDTVFLLIAAMLVAPFAGPAMNLALATARGDAELAKRSLLRYFASLGVTVAASAGLSLALRQEVATGLMIDQSQVSSVAVLLPLVAGAAGALNLLQSERSSLVSGAAVGMLVAASLAPPAGIVGMGAAIGEWAMAGSGLYLLFLQLVGINLGGAAVFRWAGVATEGPRYDRGRPWVTWTSAGVSLVLLVALLGLQLHRSPMLQRSTESQRATAEVHDLVAQSGVAELVAADLRFTRANVTGQNTLLVQLYVQPNDPTADLDAVEDRVAELVLRRLRRENVTPVVAVTAVRTGEPAVTPPRR